jgi:hypothetical protein
MKNFVGTCVLIMFRVVAMSQPTSYCPSIDYQDMALQKPIHLYDGHATSLDGRHLVIGFNYAKKFNTKDVLSYIADFDYFCTPNYIDYNHIYEYPNGLKGKVAWADLAQKVLIDSSGNGWYIDKFNKSILKLDVIDSAETMVWAIDGKLISNKNRRYSPGTPLIETLDLDSGTSISKLIPYSNWYFLDSTGYFIHFSESTTPGHYAPQDTLYYPRPNPTDIHKKLVRLAYPYEVYAPANGAFEKIFTLDTLTEFPDYRIHSFSGDNYLNLKHRYHKKFILIDLDGHLADTAKYTYLLRQFKTTDTCFQSHHNNLITISGGILYQTSFSSSPEELHPIAPAISLSMCSKDNALYALAHDSLFEWGGKGWHVLMPVAQAHAIHRHPSGKLLFFRSDSLGFIDINNLSTELYAYPNAKGKVQFLGDTIIAYITDSLLYSFDYKSFVWIEMKGISQVRTIGYLAADRVIMALDNNGFAYSTNLGRSFKHLQGGTLPAGLPNQVKPVFFSHIPQHFDLLNEAETLNYSFAYDTLQQTIRILKLSYLWSYDAPDFFVSQVFGSLPYKSRMAVNINAYNNTLNVILTDFGLLRFDCTGPIEETVRNEHSTLYPNPASDWVYFPVYVSYTIYSLDGQTLLRGEGEQVDVRALPQGVYLVETMGHGVRAYQKLALYRP